MKGEGTQGPRARKRKLSAGWGKPNRETLSGVEVYSEKVDVRDQMCLTFAFLEIIGKVFHFHTWIGG